MANLNVKMLKKYEALSISDLYCLIQYAEQHMGHSKTYKTIWMFAEQEMMKRIIFLSKP